MIATVIVLRANPLSTTTVTTTQGNGPGVLRTFRLAQYGGDGENHYSYYGMIWQGVRFIIESMLSWLLSSNVTSPRYAGISVTDAQLAAEAAVHPLEERVQSLELACAGLWHLLKAKHGFTDVELVEAIHEVDGMDGAIDGKMRPAVDFVCPSCHRKPLVRKGTTCSWCGADLGRPPL